MFTLNMLNQQQTKVFNYIKQLAQDDVANNFEQQNLLFVSGEAGTGKSYLLRQIVDELPRIYCNEDCVKVCAYTGVAAMNIAGSTIHSLLKIELPFQRKRDPANIARYMSFFFNKMRWLIIDEISFVGKNLFTIIEERLRYIDNDKVFGGVNILCFGDLLQLPPVSAQYIFKNPLWLNFKFFELTEIKRQENDLLFAQLCSRARIGQLTQSDYEWIATRYENNLSKETIDSFSKAIYIVLLKKEAEAINTIEQSKLNGHNDFIAIDQKRGDVGAISDFDVPKMIRLAVGSRVMLKKNISVEQRLVNGRIGTVIIVNVDQKFVVVDFGEKQIIRIKPEHFVLNCGKNVYFTRIQLPLIHAWAINAHKLQGLTLDKAVVMLRGKFFCSGLLYTIVSRVRSMNDFMFSELSSKMILTPNHSLIALQELRRLRQEACIRY